MFLASFVARFKRIVPFSTSAILFQICQNSVCGVTKGHVKQGLFSWHDLSNKKEHAVRFRSDQIGFKRAILAELALVVGVPPNIWDRAMIGHPIAHPADSYEISEQLLALHNHVVEAHQCSECRQLLHKLANSIHVAQFDTKLVKKKAKSLPPFRRRFSPR